MKYCTNSPGCEEDHCRCDEEIENEDQSPQDEDKVI